MLIILSGFDFDLRQVDKQELEYKLMEANEEEAIDGILVYYPIFPNNISQDRYIQETLSLDKDVEGLCHKHL